MCDYPDTYIEDKDKACQEGYYKIGLTTTKYENGLAHYHFYRQDNNGYWSHKRYSVINWDLPWRKIEDPEQAYRDYSLYWGPNFSEWCGFYCVS